MCGIVGFLNPSFDKKQYFGILKKMLSRISHRGPDEAGCYIDDNVAMGTMRLSIIDLKYGIQPIYDKTKRYWICYNGEVYNYKELREELINQGETFETYSDTEVVLISWIKWGAECLKKFNGAFAFAIYDSKKKSLFLARDRFGKRPLFYYTNNSEFVFTSEVKVFLAYNDFQFELDYEKIKSILSIWTPLPFQSAFKNIKQVPMGCYCIVENNIVKIKKYFELDFKSSINLKDEKEVISVLKEKMKKSVEFRLRSDVDVGIYLSGGLDSSITTQIATQIVPNRIHTFSVEFKEKEFDESKDQAKVAKSYNTKHKSILISDKDIVNNFQKAIYHAEVPVFRSALVPMYLLSKIVQDAGIKVILSGEGADETFLGYNIFKDTLLRLSWKKMSNHERIEKLKKIYPYLEHFQGKNTSLLIGLYQQFSKESLPGLFSHEMRFQNGCFSTRLLNNNSNNFEAINEFINQSSYYNELSSIEKAQWLEFNTLLSGYLLSSQGERMGLAHGVENRCPFLDPDVVDFASAVNLKFNDVYNEKYLLKKAYANVLPESIIKKNKHPYRAPDSTPFIKNKPEYLELLLSEKELTKVPFLNLKFCKLLIKKVFSSKSSISIKENQTFIFLISIVLLNYFIYKKII